MSFEINPDPSTWLVLGSGPDTLLYLDDVREWYPEATVITCNSGVQLLIPHYYFLSDAKACEFFSEKTKELQSKHGTNIITLNRELTALKMRGVDHADEFIEMVRGDRGYTKGKFTDCVFAGLFCLQYALTHGAKLILAVGHNGYPVDNTMQPHWYKDDIDIRADTWKWRTEAMIAPFWQKAVRENPEVMFRLFGKLNFDIDGPNVEKMVYDENKNNTTVAAPPSGQCL